MRMEICGEKNTQRISVEVAHIGILLSEGEKPLKESQWQADLKSLHKCFNTLNMVSLPLQQHVA